MTADVSACVFNCTHLFSLLSEMADGLPYHSRASDFNLQLFLWFAVPLSCFLHSVDGSKVRYCFHWQCVSQQASRCVEVALRYQLLPTRLCMSIVTLLNWRSFVPIRQIAEAIQNSNEQSDRLRKQFNKIQINNVSDARFLAACMQLPEWREDLCRSSAGASLMIIITEILHSMGLTWAYSSTAAMYIQLGLCIMYNIVQHPLKK